MTRTLAFALTLAAAGCLAAPPPTDDAEEAISRAAPTDADPWVVALHWGSRGCTGMVLSPHWILTAAHCAAVAPSTPMQVTQFLLPNSVRHLYDGSAAYFPNPAWDATCPLDVCIDSDADDDIGLIELTGGALDPGVTGRATLFDGALEPYHGDGDRHFLMVGNGLGTDAGGSKYCSDGDNRKKRIGTGYIVDVSGDDFQAHAPYGDTRPCPGDSGAPWIFPHGEQHLVFGVMSTARPDLGILGPKMYAALVKPRFGWIAATSAPTAHPLTCRGFLRAGFRTCDEAPVNAPF